MKMSIEVPDVIIQKMESLATQRKRLEIMHDHLTNSRSHNVDARVRYDGELEHYIRSLEEMVNDFYSLMTEPDDKIERVANAVADAVQQPAKNSGNTEGS